MQSISELYKNYKDYQIKYTINDNEYVTTQQVEKILTQDLFIIKYFKLQPMNIHVKSDSFTELIFLAKFGNGQLPFVSLEGFSPSKKETIDDDLVRTIDFFILTKYMENHDLMMAFENDTLLPQDLITSWDYAKNSRPDLEEVKLPTLDGDTKMKIMYGLAFGLNIMHKNHILHGDIHPSNILFNDQNEPLISDFILTKDIILDDNYQKSSIFAKQYPYMAPELLVDKVIDFRSDVYSYAVIVLQLLAGSLKFREKYNPFLVDQKVYQDFCRSSDIYNIPKQIPKPLADLLTKCLSHNPSDRVPIENFINFFNDKNLLSSFQEFLQFDTKSFEEYVAKLEKALNDLVKIDSTEEEETHEFQF